MYIAEDYGAAVWIDVEYRYLNEWPELLFVRDCYDAARNEAGLPSYSTLLHAACEVRNL